ncbi:MAG: 50S ribosomal protein L29 [Bacteroidota bacterium]|nr:50S ribosomal protein L29 [Bacteroidota bacterium]
MKSKEIKIITELTTKEVRDAIKEQRLALTKLRLAHAVSPLENPNKIRDTRKHIARLKTEMRQREFAAQIETAISNGKG